MVEYDVFISYSRRDKSLVDNIVETIRQNGYRVWIDVDGIESGEAFRRNIVEAIENSSLMIFFSSEASNSSKWTTKEISLGVAYNKHIIPIKLDKASYNKSIIFDLIDIDYIDMSDEKLFDASVQKLLRTLTSKIGYRQFDTDQFDSDHYAETIMMPTNKGNLSQQSNKSLIQSIRDGWKERNKVVNYVLCALILSACCAFIFGVPYLPTAITGLIGLYMLFLDKKDGLAFIVGAGLFWTLANAFEAAHASNTFRFFRESHFLVAWSPLVVTLLTISLLFIKKDGTTWSSNCKGISTFAVIFLTLVVGLWVWIIYFDYATKLGLPPNLRHYIGRILN